MADDLDKPKEIRFVFEKARHHRTFHADGAWASTTPRGEIQISFFNDLRPVPSFTFQEVSEVGLLGKELSREIRAEDITRELNVTVVLNTETIQRLVELLSKLKAGLELEDKERTLAESESKGEGVSRST